MSSLEDWVATQYPLSVAGLLRSISPAREHLRKGVGQRIAARRGAIVASPVPGAYDPDPDYWFHWYRDSALVIDALRVAYADGALGPAALTHFGDFVHFSVSLTGLDGRLLCADSRWRERVAPDYRQFLRPEEELRHVHGAQVAAEARVNCDGTLDVLKWARPQHDGPPLRALTVLRWLEHVRGNPALMTELEALLVADLEFTATRWHQPSFDIWEEEPGSHYYIVSVAAAALAAGARWLAGRDPDGARRCEQESQAARSALDRYWSEPSGYYRSRLACGDRSPKELDIAVILAALHARHEGSHGVTDPRMHATLARLEQLFRAEYPINQQRCGRPGCALGRYRGDVYFSGGAYFFSTLAAAELCYRAAAAATSTRAAELSEHGDGFLATVRAFTPADGRLAEQFDQRTGAAASARDLAWSHAALITCCAARRGALARS